MMWMWTCCHIGPRDLTNIFNRFIMKYSIYLTKLTMSNESNGSDDQKRPQWVDDAAEILNKEGFDDAQGVYEGRKGGGAVRALPPEGQKISDKVKERAAEIMRTEEGVPEENATARAVDLVVGEEVEKKPRVFPDIATFIRSQKERMERDKVAIDELPGDVQELCRAYLTGPGVYVFEPDGSKRDSVYFLDKTGSYVKRCDVPRYPFFRYDWGSGHILMKDGREPRSDDQDCQQFGRDLEKVSAQLGFVKSRTDPAGIHPECPSDSTDLFNAKMADYRKIIGAYDAVLKEREERAKQEAAERRAGEFEF